MDSSCIFACTQAMLTYLAKISFHTLVALLISETHDYTMSRVEIPTELLLTFDS